MAETELRKLAEQLLEQEKKLRFSEFSSQTAWKIGSLIVERAKAAGAPIAVDITLNGHQLFHFSFEGTSHDNDAWIKRKSNTVNRFGHSSLYISALVKLGELDLANFGVDRAEYAPNGGSFPLLLQNTGAVGTITVSGLTSEEDHAYVVTAIADYLKKPL